MNIFCTILVLGSVLASIAIQYQPAAIDNRPLIVGACLANGVSFFFIGPNKLLPQNYQLMALGEFIAGAAMCYQSVIGFSELLARAQELFPGREDECSDFCSAVMNTFYSLGAACGYAYGANAYNAFGF